MEFYDDFYKKIPSGLSMIEFGGGPTIYQLISASVKVKSIVFAEFAKSNRDEIIKFINNEKCWDWNEYIKYVLELNKTKLTEKLIEQVKNRISRKISKVIPCDIRLKNPLYPEKFSQFDILSMGSVADSISSTEEELVGGLRNSFTLLKPGGYFVGFFAKNFTSWTHLNLVYKIFPINEDYIKELFPKLNLKITSLTNSVPPDYKQEYEGIFAVSAVKSE